MAPSTAISDWVAGALARREAVGQGHARYHEHHPDHAIPAVAAHDDGIFRRVTYDGIDYIRFCVRHQWADLPVSRWEDIEECSLCRAEREAEGGHKRYRDLVGLHDRA